MLNSNKAAWSMKSSSIPLGGSEHPVRFCSIVLKSQSIVQELGPRRLLHSIGCAWSQIQGCLGHRAHYILLPGLFHVSQFFLQNSFHCLQTLLRICYVISATSDIIINISLILRRFAKLRISQSGAARYSQNPQVDRYGDCAAMTLI